MAGRRSAATERALQRIAQGSTAYAAAKAEGIALSTIYRAVAQDRAKARRKRKAK
jgi:F0F1-type ATP synthase membrane subunit c/vacuolar-type H+-ATPase subunit K